MLRTLWKKPGFDKKPRVNALHAIIIYGNVYINIFNTLPQYGFSSGKTIRDKFFKLLKLDAINFFTSLSLNVVGKPNIVHEI